MNDRKELRSSTPCLRLVILALVMAVVPGCISDDPSAVVSNLASDLARQIVTWWLF